MHNKNVFERLSFTKAPLALQDGQIEQGRCCSGGHEGCDWYQGYESSNKARLVWLQVLYARRENKAL